MTYGVGYEAVTVEKLKALTLSYLISVGFTDIKLKKVEEGKAMLVIRYECLHMRKLENASKQIKFSPFFLLFLLYLSS